jgi:hypothetical protein
LKTNNSHDAEAGYQHKRARVNFALMERREWWLNRPYRRASTFESARETICHCSGSQFDPQVVDAFLRIPEETWLTIARNRRQVAAISSEDHGNLGMLRKDLGLVS